jgi:hypothetical protein
VDRAQGVVGAVVGVLGLPRRFAVGVAVGGEGVHLGDEFGDVA